jgi:hypothetical protein
MTHTLPHHETERQRSVTNIWSCILGNQGFLHIGAPITELLTTSLAKNATGRRQNTYSKIINVTDCKTSKKRSLAVKYLILIMFNYPTAKTRTLYISTDGPAGRPTDNPPNPDGLWDLHRTVPELTVQVCWQPGLPIWQQFGFDPNRHPKWRSGTVANTSCGAMVEFNNRVAWVSIPILGIHQPVAQASQIHWLPATTPITGWMYSHQVQRGRDMAILILGTVDVPKGYGCSGLPNHYLQ